VIGTLRDGELERGGRPRNSTTSAPTWKGNSFAHSTGAGDLGERVRSRARAERFRGTPDLPNFLRKPYGPGWALVGDAGLAMYDFTTELASLAPPRPEAVALFEALAGRQEEIDRFLGALTSGMNRRGAFGLDPVTI
jgi:hypothetical protein